MVIDLYWARKCVWTIQIPGVENTKIKKGFFDKPKIKPKEKTTNTTNKPKEEIIDVSHNPNKNSLVFDEVQQNMQSLKNMDPKQYITQDLLNKMGSDPDMVKMFQDQEFMSVMSQGKTNPKAIAE